MKPYHFLQCDNINTIQHKVLNFIETNTSLLDHVSHPWNFINTKELLQQVPELWDYFKSLKLFPNNMSFVVLKNDLKLHVDVPPVCAKLNFPILNANKATNYWVNMPKEVYSQAPFYTDQLGNEVYDLSFFSESELNQYTKTIVEDFDQPMVFNSFIPHGVWYHPQDDQPRIILSVTFIKEPIEYLQ